MNPNINNASPELIEILEEIEIENLWEPMSQFFPHIARLGSEKFMIMVKDKVGREAMMMNVFVIKHLLEFRDIVGKIEELEVYSSTLDLVLYNYELACKNFDESITASEDMDIITWHIYANRAYHFMLETYKLAEVL